MDDFGAPMSPLHLGCCLVAYPSFLLLGRVGAYQPSSHIFNKHSWQGHLLEVSKQKATISVLANGRDAKWRNPHIPLNSAMPIKATTTPRTNCGAN